jgi:UDP-glucose 4-epimerase
MVYGPGDTHGSYGPNRFFRTAPHGRITLFGQGEERRDFVFVDDVARLIERVVSGRTTGVLNVATGRTASFEAVARLVAAALPWEVEITHQPRALPIVHRDFDLSEVARLFPDFQYTPLEHGLARTAAALDPQQPVRL